MENQIAADKILADFVLGFFTFSVIPYPATQNIEHGDLSDVNI